MSANIQLDTRITVDALLALHELIHNEVRQAITELQSNPDHLDEHLVAFNSEGEPVEIHRREITDPDIDTLCHGYAPAFVVRRMVARGEADCPTRLAIQAINEEHGVIHLYEVDCGAATDADPLIFVGEHIYFYGYPHVDVVH
jgi:hypothetical protein